MFEPDSCVRYIDETKCGHQNYDPRSHKEIWPHGDALCGQNLETTSYIHIIT